MKKRGGGGVITVARKIKGFTKLLLPRFCLRFTSEAEGLKFCSNALI
jgi:hypothetical protein